MEINKMEEATAKEKELGLIRNYHSNNFCGFEFLPTALQMSAKMHRFIGGEADFIVMKKMTCPNLC